MCIVLSAIITYIVHKDWVKIVICAKEHTIYRGVGSSLWLGAGLKVEAND